MLLRVGSDVASPGTLCRGAALGVLRPELATDDGRNGGTGVPLRVSGTARRLDRTLGAARGTPLPMRLGSFSTRNSLVVEEALGVALRSTGRMSSTLAPPPIEMRCGDCGASGGGCAPSTCSLDLRCTDVCRGDAFACEGGGMFIDARPRTVRCERSVLPGDAGVRVAVEPADEASACPPSSSGMLMCAARAEVEAPAPAPADMALSCCSIR